MKRCALLFDAPDGGVAEHVARLALGLRNRGWDPWLVGPEDAATYLTVGGGVVPIARLPFRPGYHHPLDDIRVLLGVIALLRRNRFDLVNTHSPKIGVMGRMVASFLELPVVATAHGFAFNPAVRPWPGRAVSLAVERRLASRTDAIICVSGEVRQQALDRHLAPAEILHTVHNGAPACDATLEPDEALEGFSSEGPLAGCISVLRAGKGVEVFIQAAQEVLTILPEARLAVIGNGEAREQLERYSRDLGLDGRFRFFDYRPPSARQLQAIDVFVLPSPWDAFGIAALEAMACGVPQVATNAGGVPEVVSDGVTGLLCPPNDPTALADRIFRLLSDASLRTRMSNASRERHRSLFTLDRMLDETAAVFDRVVADRSKVLRS